jgi:hypothetical protein
MLRLPEFLTSHLPLALTVSTKTQKSLVNLAPKIGNLLLDLCLSVCPDSDEALRIFWIVFRDVAHAHSRGHIGFKKYERVGCLRIALKTLSRQNISRSASQDRFESLTQTKTVSGEDRLREFFPSLEQLPLEDQCLLILRDKHQLSWDELCGVFDLDRPSLEFRYVQALRALSRRIWS